MSVDIQVYVFLVDLRDLPFRGFDVILRMDWLIEHGEKIDFEMKRLSFRIEDGFEIVIIGERLEFLSNMVSETKDEKLLSKGCEAYLAYVLNSKSKDLRVQDIRM